MLFLIIQTEGNDIDFYGALVKKIIKSNNYYYLKLKNTLFCTITFLCKVFCSGISLRTNSASGTLFFQLFKNLQPVSILPRLCIRPLYLTKPNRCLFKVKWLSIPVCCRLLRKQNKIVIRFRYFSAKCSNFLKFFISITFQLPVLAV